MVLQDATVAADNYQYAYTYNTFDFTGRDALSGGLQSIYGNQRGDLAAKRRER